MAINNYPWGHSRRYNSYSEYFRREFGTRVQKVTLDAGFTCPNRDGLKGIGGCTYCNNDAFNPSYCQPHKSITQQITEGIDFHKVRYRRAGNYLAYFQAYSNTYGSLEYLKSLYDEALSFPGISGLVIGTRPDCIDEQKLEYFARLAETHYVIIDTLPAWKLIFCGIAAVQTMLVKFVLNYQSIHTTVQNSLPELRQRLTI